MEKKKWLPEHNNRDVSEQVKIRAIKKTSLFGQEMWLL